MRLFVQADVPISIEHAWLIDLCRYIEKVLCPEIKALAGSFAESDPERPGKWSYAPDALSCLPMKITASAFPPETVRLGDGLQERGFAGSFFTRKKNISWNES